MIVFSNRQLGPASELLVSRAVAEAILCATAAAARPEAAARWEHELVGWLEDRARALTATIDVAELAWTPDHFDRQRWFLLAAIERAAETSDHARALRRWAQMIEAHPRHAVQFGRRWIRHATA